MPTARDSRWVPVSELSALARALLSEDLGGRDTVPGHVAARALARAEEWADHGFTEQTVRPWKDAPPAAAAYLAQRGVDPGLLDLPIEAYPGTPEISLRSAISSGRVPVERAYELLVLTGQHRPREVVPPAGGPAVPGPLQLFSAPGAPAGPGAGAPVAPPATAAPQPGSAPSPATVPQPATVPPPGPGGAPRPRPAVAPVIFSHPPET